MSQRMLPLRVGVGVALGFAVGLALTNKVIEGGRTDWPATGLLGWGIMVGTVAGFLAGWGMRRWIGDRLKAHAAHWILLGLALGPPCAVVVHAVFWDMGPPFLGVSGGVAAIGLWNGVLLGVAFGKRRD
ncbi:MAG: hypothetical protein OXT72_06445 [Gammaproteobacteria bacterium]|nr:hypothetical protein [Gammaproteobacteria bacterium]MYA43383.1 hypothetical protein [Gemmatimonadota bacterium]MYE94573.1 hypothetical protein [Gemmatimonadota bacterium]MYJ10351.1 hypothetical protein [Gemmatimonadota bacterium]